MIGEDFKYNGIWLSHFGMKMYDPDEPQSFVSREIEKGDLSSIRHVANHYTVHYTDVLKFNFLIIKDICLYSTQKDLLLSEDELNDLRTWLESPKTPCELFLQDETNEKDTYYYGIFTDVQPFLVGEECYGLKMSFTCNAPYGFSPIVSKTININGINGKFQIVYPNKSAEINEYMKPKIIINSNSGFSGGEVIEFKNISDNNKVMKITLNDNLAQKSQIIIDCQKKIVTDENGGLISLKDIGFSFHKNSENMFYNMISAMTTDIYWLRFLHGNNELQINVSSEKSNSISDIRIYGRYPVKAGGF